MSGKGCPICGRWDEVYYRWRGRRRMYYCYRCGVFVPEQTKSNLRRLE